MARNQATQPNPTEVSQAALNAVTLASNALDQAKQMLVAAGMDPSSIGAVGAANQPPANTSRSSGGRTPSPQQMEIRKLISDWCVNSPDIFTIKSMTEHLGKDAVQTRNAIKALQAEGLIVPWAEKFNEGRGNREHIYKPKDFDVGM